MTVMEQLAKLEKEFSPEQAKVLMDVIEQQTVTREYLRSELQIVNSDLKGEIQSLKTYATELRNQVVLALLVITGVALGIAKVWL
jgi:hypothetical protein